MSANTVQSGVLEVPYGVDAAGRLVSIDDAAKGNQYCCPGCGSALVLRAGEINRKHFAHAAHGECSSESILHKTAKRLIVQAVTDWKDTGVEAPCVVNTCSLCGDVREDPMPDRIVSAQEECEVFSQYRVDVGMFDADGLCAAVEVKVTHAVDDEKASGLDYFPWIEVDAASILRNPTRWVPVNGLRLTDMHGECECRAIMSAKLRNYCEGVAIRTGQVLPDAGFLYAPYQCWDCRSEMIVYAWESNIHSQTGKPPSDLPCPTSVEYRYSHDSGGSYHMNCCPNCDRTQGHFFLHGEPNGPFFGLYEHRRGDEQLAQALIALHLSRSRLIDLPASL